jgi:hypothetical protein
MIEKLFAHDSISGGYKTEPHDSVIDTDTVLTAAEVSVKQGGPWAETWLDMTDFTWCIRVLLRAKNESVTEAQEKILQLKMEEVVGTTL